MFAFLVVECIISIKPVYKVSASPYYCFCFNAEQEKSKQISQVKTMGGAGIEFSVSGENYIAVALYKDKDTAEKIASKNNGVVRQISLPLLTFYDKNQANDTKICYENISFYLSQLVDLSSEYDNGRATQSALKSGINNYLDFLQSNKLEYFPQIKESYEENLSAYIKFLACDLLFYSIDFFCQ